VFECCRRSEVQSFGTKVPTFLATLPKLVAWCGWRFRAWWSACRAERAVEAEAGGSGGMWNVEAEGETEGGSGGEAEGEARAARDEVDEL
jgi:hypothetical protein